MSSEFWPVAAFAAFGILAMAMAWVSVPPKTDAGIVLFLASMFAWLAMTGPSEQRATCWFFCLLAVLIALQKLNVFPFRIEGVHDFSIAILCLVFVLASTRLRLQYGLFGLAAGASGCWKLRMSLRSAAR